MKTSMKGMVALCVGVVLSVSSAVYGTITDSLLKLANLETNILFFYLCGLFLIGLGLGVVLASKRDE